MANVQERKAIEFRKAIEDIYETNSGTSLELAVKKATERSNDVRAAWIMTPYSSGTL